MLKPLSVEQLRLMDTSVEDLLEEYKITPAIATDWHKAGYLSFDPLAFKELGEVQEIEFRFISSLFTSGLSLKSVKTLLKRLEKPYRYDLQSVYFDLLKNDWEYQLRIPEVEEQIEELIGNEENDVLLEIKDRIEEYLDKLEENEKN